MPTFSLEEVILFVLATMSILCGLIVLFVLRLEKSSKRYLALRFLCMAIILILYQDYIIDKEWNLLVRTIFDLSATIHAVSFLAFVRSVLFGPIKLQKSPVLWVWPSFRIVLVILVLLFLLDPLAFLVEIIPHALIENIDNIYSYILYFLCIKAVYDYKKLTKNSVADLRPYQHKWVLVIIWIQIIYPLLPQLWFYSLQFVEIDIGSSLSYYFAGVLIFIYLASLLLITLIYSSTTLAISAEVQRDFEPSDSQANKAVDQVQLSRVYQRIQQLFHDEQIYEMPDLKLSVLANRLDISARNISSAINSCGGKNFYEFVNEFRIAAAKMILEQNKDAQLTMQEVMFDVGYSSKSSFNKEFKKNTGLTPLQYRKKMSANT